MANGLSPDSFTKIKIKIMKTEESIFQVGDKVCDFRYGWGEVKRINCGVNYPIEVYFAGAIMTYSNKGFSNKTDKNPTLSFTEYDFVNGGFSQVRPRPDIEVDTLVYVRNVGNGLWYMRYFSHFNERGRFRCFDNQLKSTETKRTATWDEYSLTNPLI